MRYAALVFTLIFPVAVLADKSDSAPARVGIAVEIDFEPVAALCTFRTSDSLKVVRALYVPIEEKSDVRLIRSDGARSLQPWLIGCPAPAHIEADSQVSVVIERANGATVSRSVAADALVSTERLLDSEEDARQYLNKQKEISTSFAVQIKAQEAELRRLRGNADRGGQHGAIAELEQKERDGLVRLSEAEQNLSNLQESVKEIRAAPPPPNAAAMEVEITKQLGELAQAARGAESSEQQRAAQGNSHLQNTMRVIEDTRFDDVEKIRAELVKMRRRRQELEESLQGNGGSPLDYE